MIARESLGYVDGDHRRRFRARVWRVAAALLLVFWALVAWELMR